MVRILGLVMAFLVCIVTDLSRPCQALASVDSGDEDEPSEAVTTQFFTVNYQLGSKSIFTIGTTPVVDREKMRSSLAKAIGCENISPEAPDARLGRAAPHSAFIRVGCDLQQLSGQGLEVKTSVDLEMLRSLITDPKVGVIAVKVELPADVPGGCSQSEIPSRKFNFGRASFCNWRAPLDTFNRKVAPLAVSFGLPLSDLRKAAFILAALLAFKLLFAIVLRLYATTAIEKGEATTWFPFQRLNQIVELAFVSAWWISLSALNVNDIVALLLLGKTSLGWAVLKSAVCFIPLALVNILGQFILFPVQSKLSASAWSRGDILLQALLSNMVLFVPLTFVRAALSLAFVSHGGGFALLLTSATLSWLVLRILLLRASGFTTSELTGGELYERIHELAKRIDFKVKKVFVVPAGKGRMANAFAATGGIVMLTEVLVTSLSKSEIDSIVAHELAHHKLGHTGGGRSLSGVLVLIGLIYATILLRSYLGGAGWGTAVILGGLMARRMFANSQTRSMEFAADQQAIALVGNGEGLITGLERLSTLNRMPKTWGKATSLLLTHPSTLERYKAICRFTGITDERLADILKPEALAVPQEHYPLPAREDHLAFSPKFKKSALLRSGLMQLAVIGVGPAIIAKAVTLLAPDEPLQGILFVAGFILWALTCLLMANALGLGHVDRLAPKIQKNLEAEGLPVPRMGGCFVGFIPRPERGTYEGHQFWDVGWLFPYGGQMYFFGERSRFALSPEQVTKLEIATDQNFWPWKIDGVVVGWSDAESGKAGEFRLAVASAPGIMACRKSNRALGVWMNQWKTASHPQAALRPQILSTVRLPEGQNGQFKSVREIATARGVINFFAMSLFLCLGTSLLLKNERVFSGGLPMAFLATCLTCATLYTYGSLFRVVRSEMGALAPATGEPTKAEGVSLGIPDSTPREDRKPG